jgi:hypothetical protein
MCTWHGSPKGRDNLSSSLETLPFWRLQRGQRLCLWHIGKRKQGFLRNHAIPQYTFLTPIGNRCITPCVCVKGSSRSRGVIPTASGLDVHKAQYSVAISGVISSDIGYGDVFVAHYVVRLQKKGGNCGYTAARSPGRTWEW